MTPNLISSKQQNILWAVPHRAGQLIHRLPVEIITEIFLFCLPVLSDSDRWTVTPSASQDQAPLLLCHVCSLWRRIALQTPALWTSLIMELSLGDSLVVLERQSQVTPFWIAQAGGHLVDLWIVTSIDADDVDKKYSSNFMIQVVHPRAERIRSLRISSRDVYDICCLLQYQHDEDTLPHHVWSFPKLEYLTLDLEEYPDDDPVLTALHSLPKLHTVVLNNVIDFYKLNIHLPWAQLTSLTIDDIPESLFRVLMAQCPALAAGRFYFRDRDSDALELPIVDVTLTRLTTFKVYFVGRSDPAIFNGIRFPALDNLALCLPCSPGNFVFIAPEHPFHQLGSITTLSLGGYISFPDMINILRGARNLTAFKVEFEDGHKEVLGVLTLSAGDEVLLPKLSVLRVWMCARHRRGTFAVVDFVKMVASRSPSRAAALGVAPLRDILVGVSNNDTLKADLDAVLEEWGPNTDMPSIQYEQIRDGYQIFRD